MPTKTRQKQWTATSPTSPRTKSRKAFIVCSRSHTPGPLGCKGELDGRDDGEAKKDRQTHSPSSSDYQKCAVVSRISKFLQGLPGWRLQPVPFSTSACDETTDFEHASFDRNRRDKEQAEARTPTYRGPSRFERTPTQRFDAVRKCWSSRFSVPRPIQPEGLFSLRNPPHFRQRTPNLKTARDAAGRRG